MQLLGVFWGGWGRSDGMGVEWSALVCDRHVASVWWCFHHRVKAPCCDLSEVSAVPRS